MKKIQILSLVLGLSLTLTSCGVNNALIVNSHQSETQVLLSSNNYRVVKTVTGSAFQEYVFLIGGAYETKLYQAAYANLVKDAGLIGGSQALINVVAEEHNGGVFPFYYRKTVTYSGQLIEFTR